MDTTMTNEERARAVLAEHEAAHGQRVGWPEHNALTARITAAITAATQQARTKALEEAAGTLEKLGDAWSLHNPDDAHTYRKAARDIRNLAAPAAGSTPTTPASEECEEQESLSADDRAFIDAAWERHVATNPWPRVADLAEQALQVCYAIERIPASTQQTAASIAAVALKDAIRALATATDAQEKVVPCRECGTATIPESQTPWGVPWTCDGCTATATGEGGE